MANFSASNYESPETQVQLDWGRIPKDWHPEVKKLYASFRDNDFSKFFYQTDVHMMRLLCEQHTIAFMNPDVKAAEWKVIWDGWNSFGTSMRSRANVRYTQAKTNVVEDYSQMANDVMNNAFFSDEDGES